MIAQDIICGNKLITTNLTKIIQKILAFFNEPITLGTFHSNVETQRRANVRFFVTAPRYPSVIEAGKHLSGPFADSEVSGFGEHRVFYRVHRLSVDRFRGLRAEEIRNMMPYARLVESLSLAVKNNIL